MRKTIRNVTIIGCLTLLPVGLFGSADQASAGRGDTSKETKAHRDLAAKIKKEVAKDDALQPSSREINVTVVNDVVTLQGTVQSDTESQEIQAKAESLAIQDTQWDRVNSKEVEIANELVVAPQH
jgi:osmotically-inducible protein OsmY